MEQISNTEHSTKPNIICFAIGSYHSNAWKSSNSKSGIYEANIAKTLDNMNCGYPACNQGGMVVVHDLD